MFEPTVFENNPSAQTPVDAAALNKLGSQYAFAKADAPEWVVTALALNETVVAAAAAAVDAAGVVYEDVADPGTFLMSANNPMTEDPADPGTYLIGA